MKAKYFFLFTATFLAACSSVYAQDPVKAAPDSYKLQFENEWVKVLRVTYAPRTNVPLHDHSRFPAAYVYLNDAGPIRFVHADWEHPVLTRPAVKGRSFRLSPTNVAGETHTVENRGDKASEFLRIEFKKLKQGKDLPHGRYPPVDIPARENFSKVVFENEHIRITRLAVTSGKSIDVKAGASAPAMLIVLSSARMSAKEGKYAAYLPGETIWLPAGESTKLENLSQQPFELLRFDLLTPKPT